MQIFLRCRCALMVEDGAFSHKIHYVTILQEILRLKGHSNWITRSTIRAFLLNGWILPIGGASAVKGLCLQPAQQACFQNNLSFEDFCVLVSGCLPPCIMKECGIKFSGASLNSKKRKVFFLFVGITKKCIYFIKGPVIVYFYVIRKKISRQCCWWPL